MGVLNKKYFNIYNQMQEDVWYTATELAVAPASMTAMVNRGLVEKTSTSPRKYRKLKNALIPIMAALEQYPSEFFGVYRKNETVGMLCSMANQRVVDCWGEPYDLSNVDRFRIGDQEFSI